MESLKKVISLNEAAKFSGYTQDYLGYLIRQGEIRGAKKGRNWFTTEEEIKNYFFKKKVRQKKFAIREFFSSSRTRKIILATFIIFISGFFILPILNKDNENSNRVIQSAVISDGDSLKIQDLNNDKIF